MHGFEVQKRPALHVFLLDCFISPWGRTQTIRQEALLGKDWADSCRGYAFVDKIDVGVDKQYAKLYHIDSDLGLMKFVSMFRNYYRQSFP